uniref:Uncharacterized protein n=1 Tax=Romanomermis culicivorax TaxID=13658 RepID=A0A915III9_ROMCU
MEYEKGQNYYHLINNIFFWMQCENFKTRPQKFQDASQKDIGQVILQDYENLKANRTIWRNSKR